MSHTSTLQPQSQRNTLILRLSSLGDVILATSALATAPLSGQKVDWVVAKEFASVLAGHPGIGRIWQFDRASGFDGWRSLCKELSDAGYDEVIDLHGSLRTLAARLLFMRFGRVSLALRMWRRLPKSRMNLMGLFLFKAFWPKFLRPRPYVERYAKFVGGQGSERPDLRYLIGQVQTPSEISALTRAYYCIMPGSKWRGKCWSAAQYVDVILENSNAMPVVLGGSSDAVSVELTALLRREGVRFVDGVGKWPLPQVAQVLGGARAYVGSDTGLAHLAESLGVPALVIYGPTTPEMGFAPWRPESRTAGMSGLVCRPCSKDGRRCYRPVRKYLCLEGLESSQITKPMREILDPRLSLRSAMSTRKPPP